MYSVEQQKEPDERSFSSGSLVTSPALERRAINQADQRSF